MKLVNALLRTYSLCLAVALLSTADKRWASAEWRQGRVQLVDDMVVPPQDCAMLLKVFLDMHLLMVLWFKV